MEEITVEEAVARFFKLGIIVSLVSVLHMLTLLLPWYVVDASPFTRSFFLGYLSTESLFFSITGGIMAGIGLLIITFVSSINKIRIIMTSLTFIGATLMLLSPFYLLMVKIPTLAVQGKLEWGFFPSVITPVILFAVGFLIAKPGFSTPSGVEAPIRYPSEPAPVMSRVNFAEPSLEVVSTPRPSRAAATEVASLVPALDVDAGTICSICYYEVDADTAVKCSSCSMVFHRDCVESWVSLNGICPNPNCQRPISL